MSSKKSQIDQNVKNQINPLKIVLKLIAVLKNEYSLIVAGSISEYIKIKIMAEEKVKVDFSNLPTNW